MPGRPVAFILWAAVLLGTAAAPAPAAPVEEGKALVEEKCTRCHGEEVYRRADRRIRSLAQLRRQVESCATAAETGWKASQKAAVVEYLNREFYRFKE